jgi:glycyl-tRNA synthetase beta chain
MQLGWDEAHQEKTLAEVRAFCLDRWRSHALESGVQTTTVNAVLAVPASSISDLSARAHAISGFLSHPAIAQLVAANKRLANLLNKADRAIDKAVDESRLVEASEKTLHGEWQAKKTQIDAAIDARDYSQAMGVLVELAEPLDDFFEHVMVMSDQAELQANRLALLNQMRNAFLRLGDLAQLGV